MKFFMDFEFLESLKDFEGFKPNLTNLILPFWRHVFHPDLYKALKKGQNSYNKFIISTLLVSSRIQEPAATGDIGQKVMGD